MAVTQKEAERKMIVALSAAEHCWKVAIDRHTHSSKLASPEALAMIAIKLLDIQEE